MLDADGVCVRAGHHCAQPLMRALAAPVHGARQLLRVQHGGDVDALVHALAEAQRLFAVA